jgi:predicted choloylglycine hydrolase
MLTSPTYSVDLERDERARWSEVIAREREVTRALLEEAAGEFRRVPELARWIFAWLYRASGGLYRGEMRAWAEALDVSAGTITLLNCAYELSHIGETHRYGCTAGVRWVNGQGLCHVRTLDWPLDGLGRGTRIFQFHNGDRQFLAVGVPGQVGVLSGMRPGAYSVTINWAPPASRPSFDFGPAFLLRNTLETCDTYDAAVAILSETRLATSVFFTVCGTKPSEACVIERTRGDSAIRSFTGTVLVQANHHRADEFDRFNACLRDLEEGETEPFLDDSRKRTDALECALAALPADCSVEALAETLDAPPILNRETRQRMLFCPRAGTIQVWGTASSAWS